MPFGISMGPSMRHSELFTTPVELIVLSEWRAILGAKITTPHTDALMS